MGRISWPSSLLCDAGVREAIRRHLDAERHEALQGLRLPASRSSGRRLARLHEDRRKLLQLHYGGKISADQFGEEQARLTLEFENLEGDTNAAVAEHVHADDLSTKFDQLAELLDRIDVARLWDAATAANVGSSSTSFSRPSRSTLAAWWWKSTERRR